jgi:ankyrin repeat protein
MEYSHTNIIQHGTLEAFQGIEGLRERLLCDFDDETSILRVLIGLDRDSHFAHGITIAPELVNLRTSKSQTVIHLCVSNMSHRILQYFTHNLTLIKSIKDEQNNWGESALHLAASIGNPSIIEKVINLQVDQSLRDKWNRTAADVAVEMGNASLLNSPFSSSFITPKVTNTPAPTVAIHSALFTPKITGELSKALLNREKKLANSRDQEILVKTIFSQNVDKIEHEKINISQRPMLPTTIPTTTGLKSLSRYIEYPGDPIALKNLLIDKDIDINGKDSYGLTALHKVVSWNQIDLVKILLTHAELNINEKTANKKEFIGYTALHFAIESRCLQIIDLLLADPRTKLDIVESNNRTFSQFATAIGEIDIVKRFSDIS